VSETVDVRVRPDRRAAMVLAPPWCTVDTDSIDNCPVRAAGIDEQLFTAGAVPHSLTSERNVAMAAFHEAGHSLFSLLSRRVWAEGRTQGYRLAGP
jgi:hypothetical protein